MYPVHWGYPGGFLWGILGYPGVSCVSVARPHKTSSALSDYRPVANRSIKKFYISGRASCERLGAFKIKAKVTESRFNTI